MEHTKSPICSSTSCPVGYECTVLEDSTERCDRCLPGYLKKGSECLAHNPCQNTSICDDNTVCISHVPYDYTCVCKDNYMWDGRTCTSCTSGYKDEGLGCFDVNECATGKHQCRSDEDCINTDGSYSCQCKHGLKAADGQSCLDINECAGKYGKSLCPSVKTTCVNQYGYFMCRCLEKGYVWYDERCVDIDECKADLHDCKNAVCQNTEGGYQCRCKEGYASKEKDLTRRRCFDTNECLEQEYQKLCEEMNASCKNTIGSYKCICPLGFVMDNLMKKCIDRNECEEDNPCHQNAVCHNLQGAYRCKCKPGFAGDGKTCAQDFASSQDKQTRTALIIVGSVGGILLSICAFMVFAWVFRKKRMNSRTEGAMVGTFDPSFDPGFNQVAGSEGVLEEEWEQYDEQYEDYGSSNDSDY